MKEEKGSLNCHHLETSESFCMSQTSTMVQTKITCSWLISKYDKFKNFQPPYALWAISVYWDVLRSAYIESNYINATYVPYKCWNFTANLLHATSVLFRLWPTHWMPPNVGGWSADSANATRGTPRRFMTFYKSCRSTAHDVTACYAFLARRVWAERIISWPRPSVYRMFQLKNYWTGKNKIWYGCCTKQE
jgi:hypothetical protein